MQSCWRSDSGFRSSLGVPPTGGVLQMRYIGCWSGIILAVAAAVALACPAEAEPQAEQPTVEALIKKIDALRGSLDEGEAGQGGAKASADKPPSDKPLAHATHHSPLPAATAI